MRRRSADRRRSGVRFVDRAARPRATRRRDDRHRSGPSRHCERRRTHRIARVQSGRAGCIGHRVPADRGVDHASRDRRPLRSRVVRSSRCRCQHGGRLCDRSRRPDHPAGAGRRRRLGRRGRRCRGERRTLHGRHHSDEPLLRHEQRRPRSRRTPRGARRRPPELRRVLLRHPARGDVCRVVPRPGAGARARRGREADHRLRRTQRRAGARASIGRSTSSRRRATPMPTVSCRNSDRRRTSTRRSSIGWRSSAACRPPTTAGS